MPSWHLEQQNKLWRGSFSAMASPCEVLIETPNRAAAAKVTRHVYNEAKRIEQHWSRFQTGNVIHRINNAQGVATKVDGETADMLDFAAELYELSQGLFDITSGVLRLVWRFDGSDNVPSMAQVADTMARVGWDKAQWKRPYLTLQAGMELDFGGCGKEYAVDQALAKAQANLDAPILVNFGGDLAANRPRRNGQPWTVEVEGSSQKIALFSGGVATSGDAERFLVKHGKRYSHCLNAKTGWPVDHAPRSVTLLADSCVEAGMAATLTMLQGKDASSFIADNELVGVLIPT